MKNLLISLLLLLSLAACKTTSKRKEASESAGANANAAPLADNPIPIQIGCSDPAPKCDAPDLNFKMLCSADLYDGKTLLKTKVLQGWGQGSCAAREALRKATCDSGKKFELVANIVCVNDPSSGECPVADQACITLLQPVMCAAKAYDGRTLSDEQAFRAWGSNSCVAQQNLKLLACKLGLRPSLMAAGDIQCWDDQSEGECPVATESCESDYVPHVCKVVMYNGQNLTRPLAAFGASQCEAKAELQQQACNQGYRPSKLGEMQCQADQDMAL